MDDPRRPPDRSIISRGSGNPEMQSRLVHTDEFHTDETSTRSAPLQHKMADDKRVFVVLVTGKLKSGQIGQFIENFKPLAAHVTEHEEGTLTYQLSTGDEDPDRLCIYER